MLEHSHRNWRRGGNFLTLLNAYPPPHPLILFAKNIYIYIYCVVTGKRWSHEKEVTPPALHLSYSPSVLQKVFVGGGNHMFPHSWIVYWSTATNGGGGWGEAFRVPFCFLGEVSKTPLHPHAPISHPPSSSISLSLYQVCLPCICLSTLDLILLTHCRSRRIPLTLAKVVLLFSFA
jgi:hypothetical protein